VKTDRMILAEDIGEVFHGTAGTIRALDGVSLSVAEGEFVLIEGPSGSGKTTLLLILGALLQPSEGTVYIDRTDPYALSPEQRARFRADRIGFVFQQFHLVPYLSVMGNVLAPALATHIEDATRRAEELATRFGLAERLHHVPAELSTGERQRTALARALLNRPKLLLADEPTGNLDRENAQRALRHMADFSRAGGAVLMVSHEGSAVQYAHRVLRLENGILREV